MIDRHDVRSHWAWIELPSHLELLVDPAAIDLIPQMLDWFETVTTGPTLSCLVMQDNRHMREALSQRGYTVKQTGPFFRRYLHDLTDLPTPSLPTGSTLSHVTAPGRRAASHRTGWSDFDSQLNADRYHDIMTTHPYQTQTDLVVVVPDGQRVASALGWTTMISHTRERPQ